MGGVRAAPFSPASAVLAAESVTHRAISDFIVEVEMDFCMAPHNMTAP
jgi:hypothetical protein